LKNKKRFGPGVFIPAFFDLNIIPQHSKIEELREFV